MIHSKSPSSYNRHTLPVILGCCGTRTLYARLNVRAEEFTQRICQLPHLLKDDVSHNCFNGPSMFCNEREASQGQGARTWMEADKRDIYFFGVISWNFSIIFWKTALQLLESNLEDSVMNPRWLGSIVNTYVFIYLTDRTLWTLTSFASSSLHFRRGLRSLPDFHQPSCRMWLGRRPANAVLMSRQDVLQPVSLRLMLSQVFWATFLFWRCTYQQLVGTWLWNSCQPPNSWPRKCTIRKVCIYATSHTTDAVIESQWTSQRLAL